MLRMLAPAADAFLAPKLQQQIEGSLRLPKAQQLRRPGELYVHTCVQQRQRDRYPAANFRRP